MIWAFPHQIAYLTRTRLSYIHLPRLLSDGKRNRSARVPGYVLIQVGESCYLIFVRHGEPFHAVSLSAQERRPVPLTEVLRRVAFEIERGEGGWIGYYGAPEAQLRVMLATQVHPALPSPNGIDLGDADRLFPALRDGQFSGIVELADDRGMHYLCFTAGEYKGGFFSDRDAAVPLPEFVRSIFGRCGTAGARLFAAPGAELPEQASPALLNLYRRLMALIHAELRTHLGEQGASETVGDVLEGLRPRYGIFDALAFRDGVLVLGDVVVSPRQLGDAVSAWVTGVLSAAAGGGADPVAMLRRAARNDRFVLDELGFFGRLPWGSPF